LHAVVQAWHPIHFVWSSTFSQRTGLLPSGTMGPTLRVR
jgi:hypothetical protein